MRDRVYLSVYQRVCSPDLLKVCWLNLALGIISGNRTITELLECRSNIHASSIKHRKAKS